MKGHALHPTRLIFTLFLFLLLAGCRPVPQRVEQAAQDQAQATQAALLVRTEIARVSQTPTPSPTPPPTATPRPPDPTATRPAMTVTPLPGLTLYRHPEMPGYVFQIDPARWQAEADGGSANLVNAAVAGCRVEAVPGSGIAPPQQLRWLDFGRFRWEVMDYGRWAFAVPVQGAGLRAGESSFLRLAGYDQRACRADQEVVLANLMLASEADMDLPFVAYASPTPRPPLEGFSCADAPPARLRVGDDAAIITNGLWLRTEPRVDQSTRKRQFNRYPPYVARIVGGPVCETYVYWQVELYGFGENADALQGWLAEGDLKEYYLVPVR
jgi:hypothetical protein